MASKKDKEKAKAEAEEKKAADAAAEKAQEEIAAAEAKAEAEIDAALDKEATESALKNQRNTNDLRSMQDWAVAKGNSDIAMGAAVRFNQDFENDMLNENQYDELIDKFGKGKANGRQ